MNSSRVNHYQYGNTVKFEGVFYNEQGEKVNPEIVKIIIYDERYKMVFEQVINNVSLGTYVYRYETPKKEQKMYYEWYGVLDGLPTIKRKPFIVKFV